MKKKVTRLSSVQKKRQAEIKAMEDALKARQEAVAEDAAKLQALKRATIMENVKSFGLMTEELDAFVSALDGFPNKQDLATAIINAAQTTGKVNVDQLATKLVRLGFI